MTWLVYVILVAPLAALFLDSFAKKWLANSKMALSIWGYFLRVSWGICGWLLLSVIVTSQLKQYVAPDQSQYFLSGSDITFWPQIFFGVVVFWVVVGPEDESDGAGRFSTCEKRIDALLSTLWEVAKGGFWLALAGIAIAIAVLIGRALESRIESMSTNSAIFFGAVVISAAIFFGLRGRR